MSLRTVVAFVLAGLLGASCVPPAEVSATPVHFDEKTVMGEIQARGKLVIGIPSDRPPFGPSPDSRLGAPEGFAVDMGRYVAAAMHVEPDFRAMPNDLLIPSLEGGSLEIAFPMTPITEKMLRQLHNSVSDPYFVGHQRLLIEVPGHTTAPTALSAYAGKKVCEYVDPETETPVERIEPAIVPVPVAQPVDCVDQLRTGAVAASASDVVLMGLEQVLPPNRPLRVRGFPFDGSFPIVGEELSTEAYGAVVEKDATGFIEVVKNILERAQADGTWTASLARWIKPLEDDSDPEPPTMTVEEAAALFPASTE